MSTKIILQNALTQLEAQRSQSYKNAYEAKTAELNGDLEAYRVEKRKEYDDAIIELKNRYECAINAKKDEIANKAKTYAEIVASDVDKNIADLKSMIERTGE